MTTHAVRQDQSELVLPRWLIVGFIPVRSTAWRPARPERRRPGILPETQVEIALARK